MTVYKSKTGLEILLPLIAILGTVLVIMVWNKVWTGVAIICLVTSFIVYTFNTTVYTISGNYLMIKCGLFYNIIIDIKTIKSVAETRNPVSSPAASLDRIKISYNKYDNIIISPKDKREFVKHITSINRNIQLSF